MGNKSTKKKEQKPKEKKIKIVEEHKYINMNDLFNAVKILASSRSGDYMLKGAEKLPPVSIPYYIDMSTFPVDIKDDDYCIAGVIDVRKIRYIKCRINKSLVPLMYISRYMTESGLTYSIKDLSQSSEDEHEGIFIGGTIPEEYAHVNLGLDTFAEMVVYRHSKRTPNFSRKEPFDLAVVLDSAIEMQVYNEKFRLLANAVYFKNAAYNGIINPLSELKVVSFTN